MAWIPNISVLIPTFMPEGYVEDCLQSLEGQTLSKDKYKVYIALNGPKDKYEKYLLGVLGDFLFSYELFYVDVAGVSNARNYLIDKSVEEYVVFIDDDDVVSPSYLEELLKISSSRVMGISNSYRFENGLNDLKENYIGRCFHKLSDITYSKFKSRRYFSSPCAKMLHRKMISNARFDIRLAIGEDSLFMAELSVRVSAVRKASETACYYVYERDGSATRRKVSAPSELKRIGYLFFRYLRMLFKGYDTMFILSRMVASLLHIRRVF